MSTLDKKMIREDITISFIIFSLIMLFTMFITGEINPMEWHSIVRFIDVSIGIVVSAIAVLQRRA